MTICAGRERYVHVTNLSVMEQAESGVYEGDRVFAAGGDVDVVTEGQEPVGYEGHTGEVDAPIAAFPIAEMLGDRRLGVVGRAGVRGCAELAVQPVRSLFALRCRECPEMRDVFVATRSGLVAGKGSAVARTVDRRRSRRSRRREHMRPRWIGCSAR